MIICGNHFSRKIWKKERFSHRASRMTASRLKLLLNLAFLQRWRGVGGVLPPPQISFSGSGAALHDSKKILIYFKLGHLQDPSSPSEVSC